MNSNLKRTTVYFDSELHRALRLKAEDAEDLAALRKRAREPNVPFEDVVKDLKRRGKI
jgi:hypothetical protein